MASASEVGEEYEDDGDDSDMYMEAESGEADRIGKGKGEGTRRESESYANATIPREESGRVVEEEEEKSEASSKWKDQEAENTKETDRTEDAAAVPDSEDKSLETESQNFFPSFADLFANHRSSFAEQQRYRNRFLGYLQRDRGYQTQGTGIGKEVHHPLLGSGNFGVIRGGTYYPDEKENDEYSVDDTLYNPYYHAGNRGRANYFRNPKPQPIRGGDFFANFRDFADITAPPKSSFSHLSVVYANKNATGGGARVTEPRNIIETLRMLEEEEGQTSSEVAVGTGEELPRKKQSKGKRKLMKMKQYEEDKARRSRITVEPLLALS